MWGDGTTFHADVKRDGDYTCKGMVNAKMFNGEDDVVLRRDGIPPQLEYFLYTISNIHAVVARDVRSGKAGAALPHLSKKRGEATIILLQNK